jgi:hypothetical protein
MNGSLAFHRPAMLLLLLLVFKTGVQAMSLAVLGSLPSR